MTREELAELLNGREYLNEITRDEAKLAKSSRLVVVFGYSDDCMEVRGASFDELTCYSGDEFRITSSGVIVDEDDMPILKKYGFSLSSSTITSEWCPEDSDCSWRFTINAPSSSFVIYEDGHPFCQGIVFSLDDI